MSSPTLRNATQAVDWAKRQISNPSQNWNSLCLKFTRSCYGVAAKYPDAKTAWANVKWRHSTTDAYSIPSGVPVYWATSSKYDHIAISIGDGKCISTDIKRRGKPDIVAIDLVTKKWGPLLGWSEDVNGVRVYTPMGFPGGIPPVLPAGKYISLSGLRNAAQTDPGKPNQNTTNYAAVKPVEDALVAKGLLDKDLADGHYGKATRAAYKRFQELCGYSGAAADGIPGRVSLRALMGPRGYTIVN